MKLKDKVVYIAGGSGKVGRGIIKVFLDEGAKVITSSRFKEKLDKLREDFENLFLIHGNIGDELDAIRIRDEILKSFNRIDVVIASIGSWWEGARIIDLDLKTYENVMFDRLTTHFICAKTFLKYMVERNEGIYVLIGGFHANVPLKNAGLISIAGAGEIMLTKVLSEELKEYKIRINEVLLPTVGKDISAEDVGKFLAYLCSDEAYMVKGQVISLYGH
ncbi:MAG: SDR family oxidoreductase [candidate division WOR-3 bacterium]|nr:SDR family oxidoreductase [candidate division WOR-3 bacterium]MCX7947346.1 SDR family oxidoreductase [candidate division WOR-3 bacterium]MDW8150098.1 SDR family oxidoreductase [candidate division WOR-3 bacterium]